LSFFNELKRRNVFKVGIAYLVVAWLVAQVLQLVFEGFGTPDWAIKTLLVLLATGFPIALLFAWAFEMTPDGIKREHEVDRSHSITTQTGKKLNFVITVLMALALAYFAYDKFVLSAGREMAAVETALEEATTLASTDQSAGKEKAESRNSIAVLPFVNMSSDTEQEYFSDGISEEILNALAKVKELKVAGRTSSFAFNGQNQDLRSIGEALGVSHILEGSVRKAGGKVRITAQLIKVDDGFHIWSETYDRELIDIFAIQDEIATAILQELKTALLDGNSRIVSAARTDSEVYDLYLLAKQRMYERSKPTLQSAADLLDKAIAIDPEYAPAYAQRGIVAILLSETNYGDLTDKQSRAQARLYLDKAISLDDNLAEAWAGLGLYFSGPPLEPDKSISALKKALSLNPNLINASNWLTLIYWEVNRAAESLALLDRVVERDPLYKPAINNRAFQLALMGRGEEARKYLAEVEPFMLGDPGIDASRAFVDFEEGNMATGLRRMTFSLEKKPSDRTFKVGVNLGYYYTHQYEQITDDHVSELMIFALLNLGRNEEAVILAREQAVNGVVRPLFTLLNASDQSELLIEYFEDRWPQLAAFEQAVPAKIFSYREMADVALAYQRVGNTARFDEAMVLLESASLKSLSDGIKSNELLLLLAAQHAMAGDTEQSLIRLAEAVDGGLITSAKISKENPYFRELDGNPQYEAIQARMIEHLNQERAELGLQPISSR